MYKQFRLNKLYKTQLIIDIHFLGNKYSNSSRVNTSLKLTKIILAFLAQGKIKCTTTNLGQSASVNNLETTESSYK